MMRKNYLGYNLQRKISEKCHLRFLPEIRWILNIVEILPGTQSKRYFRNLL
jgi:hypothetical protein